MGCSNCTAVLSEEVYVFIENKGSELSGEHTVQLCQKCYESFEETAGVTVSCTETIDQQRGR
jgi:hypothetical protein